MANELLGLGYTAANYHLARQCHSSGNAEAINGAFDVVYGDRNTPNGQMSLVDLTRGEISMLRADQGIGPHSKDWTARSVAISTEQWQNMAGSNQLESGTGQTSIDPEKVNTTARIIRATGITALLLDSVSPAGSDSRLMAAQETPEGTRTMRYNLWVPFARSPGEPAPTERRLHVVTTNPNAECNTVLVSTQVEQERIGNYIGYTTTSSETPGPQGQDTRVSTALSGFADGYHGWRPSEEDKVPGPGLEALDNFATLLSMFRNTSDRGEVLDTLNPDAVARHNTLNGTNLTQGEMITEALHILALGPLMLKSTVDPQMTLTP